MNKKIFTIALSIMLVFAMLLSACSKKEPDTLESLMKSDSDVLGSIQQEAESNGVKLTISGNEITYEYDISNQNDVDEKMLENEEYIKKYNTALDAGASIFEDYVKQTEETSEIEGLSMVVKYTYKGKEIASRVFTSTTSAESSNDKEAEGEEKAAEDSEG